MDSTFYYKLIQGYLEYTSHGVARDSSSKSSSYLRSETKNGGVEEN